MFPSFSRLDNSPWYICTCPALFIHLSINGCSGSTFWLLWIMLLWTWVLGYTSLLTSDAERHLVCLLITCLSSLGKYLRLYPFYNQAIWFLCCWVVSYQIHDLQIFSPSQWVAFSPKECYPFSKDSLLMHKIFDFGEVHLFFYSPVLLLSYPENDFLMTI